MRKADVCQRLAPSLLGAILLGCLLVPTSAIAQEGSKADHSYISVGLEGQFSLSPADDILFALDVDFGVFVLQQFNVGIAIGGGGADIATGSRGSMDFTPRLEAFWFVLDWMQVVMRGGVHLQPRWGGDIDSAFGASLEGGGAVRAWLGDCEATNARDWIEDVCGFIGVDTRLALVVTDGLLVSPRILPGGAWIWSTGFITGFAF